MTLNWKLFFSHFFVIVISLMVVAVTTLLIAPAAFSSHVEHMSNMSMMSSREQQSVKDDLNARFRETLNGALLVAGITAIVAAVGASWYISLRITRPIQKIVNASQYIAEGHYSERLSTHETGELGELTRSFNSMAASLAETEAMRQRLIGDVSHELKTPLASIKGYMEGLQDGVIAPSQDTFRIIRREVDRLQRLVHDLQELSRAEASQLQMDISPQNPIRIIKAAADWLQPQFEDKKVSLTVCLSDCSVNVLGDFDRIRQVLLNLLGNALQYTPTGGNVIVFVEQHDKFARFVVRDTGIGLDATDLKCVFQRFYRVDKSRSRAGGGSGIGLTIAQYIIEAHKGRIWVESAGLNTGSTFYFTLPQVETSSKLHTTDICASITRRIL